MEYQVGLVHNQGHHEHGHDSLSVTPDMLRKEITAHLLAYNRGRCAVVPAAKLAEDLPRVLSFTAAKQSLDRLRPTTPSHLTAALGVPDHTSFRRHCLHGNFKSPPVASNRAPKNNAPSYSLY